MCLVGSEVVVAELEAEVGIEQVWLLPHYQPIQSLLPHSQARRVTGNETACKMGVSRCFVKSPSTQSLLTNESDKTHSNRCCWHFCWHNSSPKVRAYSIRSCWFSSIRPARNNKQIC